MHLLLLPGMDGTGEMFAPMVRALPAGLTPIVVRYPVDEPLGYAGLLTYAEAALAQANGEPFIVVDESFSGPVALMLAARRPAGLHGVVLTTTFVRPPMPRMITWLHSLVSPMWFRMMPRWLMHIGLLGRHRTPALERMLAATLGQVSPCVLAARVRAMMTVDVREALAACDVPMLCLAAEHDRVVRPHCIKLMQHVQPRLQVERVTGPHLLMQAKPEEAVRLMETFVQRVRALATE